MESLGLLLPGVHRWLINYMGGYLNLGSFLGFFFIRVPCYFGALNRDPNLENYSHGCQDASWS